MNYFKTWEKLKLTFEKDSGRKKPGDTFMGVFRKPSGLEEATKKLDDAIKRADEASLEKAEKEFVLKKTNYLKVLEKSMNEEKETAIKADLNKLKIGLNAIHEDFKEAKVNALSGTVTKEMQALDSELGKVCSTLKKNLGELEVFVRGLDRVKAKLEFGAGTKNSKEFKSAADLHKKSKETFDKTAKGALDLSLKTAKRFGDSEKSWKSAGFIKGPNANGAVNELWESITASYDDATQVAGSIKDVIRDGEKGNKEVTTLQANLAKALKS